MAEVVVEASEFVVGGQQVPAQHSQVVQIARQRSCLISCVVGARHRSGGRELRSQPGLPQPAFHGLDRNTYQINAIPVCAHAFRAGTYGKLRTIASPGAGKLVIFDRCLHDSILQEGGSSIVLER